MSTTTIRKVMERYHARRILQIQKPLLTQKHKDARIAFATDELEKIKQGVPRTLFTDEMYIRMGDTQRVYIWVLPGCEYLEKNVRRVVQFGKFQAMISGGIFLGGCTDLDVLNLKKEKMSSEYYRGVVERIYLPKVRELGLRFEQDGASVHRSKYMKECFTGWEL